jgi:hypothetical protein
MRLPLRKGLVALLVASGAWAQDVTEKEFLSALRGDGPAERALEDDLARAEAAAQRSRTLANPSLEFYREAPEDNPEVTNWTLAWTPPLDGRFGLSRDAADRGVSASRGAGRRAPCAARALARGLRVGPSRCARGAGHQIESTRMLAARDAGGRTGGPRAVGPAVRPGRAGAGGPAGPGRSHARRRPRPALRPAGEAPRAHGTRPSGG